MVKKKSQYDKKLHQIQDIKKILLHNFTSPGKKIDN